MRDRVCGHSGSAGAALSVLPLLFGCGSDDSGAAGAGRVGATAGAGGSAAAGGSAGSGGIGGAGGTAAGGGSAGTGAARAQLVRIDEVKAGVIEHRLECYWHATGRPDAATPWYYWPMVGYEPDKGGIVPEGIVIRIQPSIDLSKKGLSPAALVIATALQQYGCMIGDNAGGNGNRLKVERDEVAWKALDPALAANSLAAIPWSEWEFVEGGYDPP